MLINALSENQDTPFNTNYSFIESKFTLLLAQVYFRFWNYVSVLLHLTKVDNRGKLITRHVGNLIIFQARLLKSMQRWPCC